MKAEKQKAEEKESLVDSRWAYRGRIVNLKLETYQIGHQAKIAEIIYHSGAAVIVPIDEKGRILVEENKIHDAKTIAGLFKYQLWKERCAKH